MKREDLTQFRREIKENKDGGKELTERYEELLEALYDPDAKIRKNTALLIGELPWKEEDKNKILQSLLKAYVDEAVLYVKASYLKGIFNLSVPLSAAMKERLERRLDYLLEEEVTPDKKKHIKEESRWIMMLLEKEERPHTFKGLQKKVPLLLTVPKDHENYLLHELKRKGANPEDLRKTPFGIRVMTEDLSPILSSRIYDKIYFIVPIQRGGKLLLSNRNETIATSMLDHMLSMYLEGSGAIPFRVSVRLENPDKDETHKVSELFSDTLEELFPGKLYNAPGNYEVELFFAQRKDESFGMYLWIQAFKNDRFLYRSKKMDTSMAPTKAATMLEMAYPYLKEEGIVLDPFCGSGTLLIERQKLKTPMETFGTDTYQKAVAEAREAAKTEGVTINFIQRDYFDFTFDGMFDEIVTEFPDLFHKEKEEKYLFLKKFFQTSVTLTRSGAVWLVLTNENGSVKQQIKRTGKVRLLREIPFGGKRSLFIIERK